MTNSDLARRRWAIPSSRRPIPWRRWLVGCAVFLFVTSAAAQTKIAVVDLQGAMMQTEDGLRAAATLRNYTHSRQSELDQRQDDLQREQTDLQKQARVLSRRALQRRTEHWQRRMVSVQTKFIEYNKQLQKKQNDLMKPIIRKMFKAIKRVANREGFDIVVDRAAVPFARTDLDLTDRVVQLYNSGGGGSDQGADKKADDKKGD
ncbi:MAG: OmpH family outer membrane protein [Deltaproteobacteria bacterium]|nr:MAG: OmpH family outer membrane protein [Deltaproteobacteria bacterium]